MSINYKKYNMKRNTYLAKYELKHKHNYCIEYLLEITNINKHASINYFKSKEYHYVLKCDLCDSFIPKIEEGNFSATIFDVDNINKNLSLITANTNFKNPHYDFCKLFDVVVYDKINK